MSKLKKNNGDPPARTPEKRAFHDDVRTDFVRNAVFMVLFDTIWFIGMAFVIYAVFVPAYLNTLHAPKFVIGLVAAGFSITVPANFLAGRLLGSRKRNVWLSRMYMCGGILVAATGVVSWLLASFGLSVMVLVFSLGMFSFCIAINLIAPIYWEVFTDNIPLRWRGRVYAVRVSVAGVVGFGAIYPARWITSQFDSLTAYHVAMIMGGSFYAIASLIALFFRDHPDPGRLKSIQSSLNLRHEIYLLVLKLWYRPSYRVFIFFSTLLLGSGLLGSFLVTYAQDMLGAEGKGFVAHLKMVYLGVMVLGGFIFGTLADRWGFRNALILLAGCSVFSFLTVLIFWGIIPFMFAYGLYAVVIVFLPNMMTNLSLELMPKVPVRMLASAMNLFCLPVNIMLPWICGWVIDANKNAGDVGGGYRVVFTVSIMLASLAAFGFFLLVQEPRHGKHLIYQAMRRT